MKMSLTLPSEATVKLVKWLLIILLLLTVQVTESVGRYSFVKLKPTPSSDQYQCRCNITEIYEELPYFLQEMGRDEHFDWAFQGTKGERGADGPQGPADYPRLIARGLPGYSGARGEKGERGEPGPRGLPGTSMVFNPKGSLFGNGGEGEKGSAGPRGNPGRKGDKGEAGTMFTTVLRNGSYFEVKGQKGDRGGRGRKGVKGELGETGLPGRNGLSIQGEKGAKGEPAILPDLELLRGPPGERGVIGLPGPPGIGCRPQRDYGSDSSSCGNSSPPVIFQKKGEKGDTGMPGVSVMGEKGDIGPAGPPGTLPPDFRGTFVYNSEAEMTSERRPSGTIAFIEREERAFIKVTSGWRELSLGRFLPDQGRGFIEENRLPSEDEERHHSYYRYDDQRDESVPRKQYFQEKLSARKRYRRRHLHRGRVAGEQTSENIEAAEG